MIELLWPEAREGIAMVIGPTGRYLGCVGVDRWWELVEEEKMRMMSEEPDPGIEWPEPRDDPDEEPSHPGAEGDDE